ncbi:MAG: NUDIX domain-containing protein [Bacteroidota bacterium]|nr:NUDIX domain-containing protein [Bacteroidota bacterium]MDP4274286.1 NUDIX domain-containing protein [Bacteroidota bacterium]
MVRILNPHISVDCVIFGFDYRNLKVLLVEMNDENIAGSTHHSLKLPGDLIAENEGLEEAAARVLCELTGLKDIYLKHFNVFGSPGRIQEGPDLEWLRKTSGMPVKRIVTVAYYALVKIEESNTDSYEFKTHWLNVNDVPALAFDHNEILGSALNSLRMQIRTEPLGFELLPQKFTKRQLQQIYEVILGVKLDNRNFRKKIANLKYIVSLNEKEKDVSHKPALLYRFDKELYMKNRKDNLGFVI